MKIFNEIKVLNSSDENVKKLIFTSDDAVAEAVLYKYPTYKDRTVICCSTQSGCPVGCRFCGAGNHFARNLTHREIVAQVVRCIDEIDCAAQDIEKFQIMFMRNILISLRIEIGLAMLN